MPTLNDLFTPQIAKSHAYDLYERGTSAFVSNGFSNNGVLGYITPKKNDRVFKSRALCISAFCEATVQEPPFIARGNGGSGLVILEPKKNLTKLQLFQVAAYINKVIRWRFSFGRMVIPDRLMHLEISTPTNTFKGISVEDIMPNPKAWKCIQHKPLTIKLGSIQITDLFHIKSGDYHKAGDLPDGEIPLISCGNKNNGLVRYCGVPEQHIYQNCLTVSYNGSPMLTKYHPYRFAAKDDVAILFPRKSMACTTIIFIQTILCREDWRYSYGRKCFKKKLSNMAINLPMKNASIDEELMKLFVEAANYWGFVAPRIHDTYLRKYE